MATPFASACGVAIANNYDTTGTFTKSQISQLSPTSWKALFTDGSVWHEMTAYLKTQFEMAACGVQRNCFYDWIMSSNRRGMQNLIGMQKLDRGASIIQPFIMARQMSIVNSDFWAIDNGFALSSYSGGQTGPLTVTQVKDALAAGATRVIRVIAGYGTNYVLPLDAKYFLPKAYIYILGRASGGGAQHGAWEVVDSAADTDDQSWIDVAIISRNSWDTYYVDQTPTKGLVLTGLNNVADVESFCKNRLNVNPIKHVPFFYQTYRDARRVSSIYREVFEKLMADNAYFSEFADIPLAERNRQDEMKSQRDFINSFLWGRRYSNAQRLEGTPNWSSLPDILSLSGASVDPGTGGQVIYKRANMEGVYEQLKGCSKNTDKLDLPLNIKTFCETNLYDVFRARDSQGRASARSIDIYTDSKTADEWLVQFVAYGKNKLGDIIRLNIEEGDTFGASWRSYRLFRPQGVVVNIIVEKVFDDLMNSFKLLPSGSIETRGRILATLDLGKGGSIYPALLGSNRKVFTTGQINDLAKIDNTFACVMENPTIETTMTSKTVTAIVECPDNNDWTENFSSITFTA